MTRRKYTKQISFSNNASAIYEFSDLNIYWQIIDAPSFMYIWIYTYMIQCNKYIHHVILEQGLLLYYVIIQMTAVRVVSV